MAMTTDSSHKYLPRDFIVFGTSWSGPRRFRQSENGWDQLVWSFGEWKFSDNHGISGVKAFYHAADQVFVNIRTTEHK